MIGIIGAMDIEVTTLKNAVENKQIKNVSGIDFVTGRISGKDVVIAKAGIGKVNAAVCAQTMILLYKPEVIINTGVAGALSDEVSFGDIVIGTDTVQHDMDTSPLGDPVGFISGIDTVYMPCDEKTREKLFAAAKNIRGLKVSQGRIATGDIFLNNDELKRKIVENFSAAAGEMEGGSIAQVCVINKVPFAVVRAISDNADGSSHADYLSFLPVAADNSAKLMLEFIKNF